VKSWRQFIIPGLFILAGLVAFSNILSAWFLSDDFAQIGKVLAGDLSVVWGREHGGFFRPLFILSYFIDAKIWGARPFGFHLTNVVFHSLNAFLTFILSLRMVENLKLTAGARRSIAIGAGAFFLLHPSHTEAVTWISGRADVLATFFCLASLWLYLSYVQSQRTSRLLLSLLSFTIALTAKESAICLPLLVVVLRLFVGPVPRDRETRQRFLTVMALYFSILLVFVGVRSVFIGSLVGGYGPSQHLNFSPTWLRDRLLEASVRSFLPALPSRLSWFLFKPLQSRVFILFSLASAGVIAAGIILRRRWYGPSDRREQNRFLVAIALLFLFSLLPVINLRLTLYQTLGERFLYLPTVFSCLLMAYLMATMLRQKMLWFSILICWLGFYSLGLYQTNRSWKEAARLSHNITDQLVDSATRDHLLILNLPDNLRGVPVFHNGLPEALEYFQNQKRFKQVEIIGFQDLQSPEDEVVVTAGPGSLSINLLNQNDSFVRWTSSPCLEPTSQSKISMAARVEPCAAGAEIFFFEKGRMTRLIDR